MAGPKEKQPKFDGDGTADPIRHCKTCQTIWRANGITDENDWMRQFPATLWGVAIDWFTSRDPQKLNSWNNIKKEFLAEFQLLHDDNEIVAEIFNTKQGKNENVRLYTRKLQDLINKMESKSVDGLQKRWFVEGLWPKLRKKMKIVPPSSYTEAYNRALNLESEQRTKKKNSSPDSNDDESSEEDSSNDENSSKKVRALQKDMIRMMEFKSMQKETKGSELWCTECKSEGHTKGSCPKNQFCDICQIMGHSTKECPFNMKTRGSQQVLLTQATSTSGGNGNANIDGATSGGYRNNSRGQNNNNNANHNNNNGNRS